MNSRMSFASLFVLALVIGACASGGGGGGAAAVSAAPVDTENLPAWVLALPEGTPPTDNEQTNEAALQLFQAQSTGDSARKATLYQMALTTAEAGIAADPANPQSYLQAGEAHLGLGNLEAAGEAFDRAEEIYPRYAVNTQFLREERWIEEYNLGVGFIRGDAGAAPTESDIAAAQTHFERAHAIYKGRPEAMFQLGERYSDLGREEDAIEVYQAAIAAIESPRGREGADAETIAAWDMAVEGVLYQLATLYYGAGRYAESADMYERILAANPDDTGALTNLGVALISAGETERANEVFARLRQRPDLSPRELYVIGVGLHDGGQLVEAAELFGDANAHMPQDRESLFMQAYSLYLAAEQGGEWAPLVPVSERLLEVDTHGVNAHQFLFRSNFQVSEGERAAGNVERANQLTTRANTVYAQMEQLPFEVDQLQMAVVEGGAALGGVVMTRAGSPGAQVRIRAHFYDGTGAQVGTGETTVTLPASGQAAQFQVDVSTTGEAMGSRYEIVN